MMQRTDVTRTSSAPPMPSAISSDVAPISHRELPSQPSAIDRMCSRLLSSNARAKKTWKLLNPGSRDIPGDTPAAAARALYFSQNVVLCTGPEGAAGTVVLGAALKLSGAQVSYVDDGESAGMIRQGLKSLDPNMGESAVNAMFHVSRSGHDETKNAVVAIQKDAEELRSANAKDLTVTVGNARMTPATVNVKASQANAGACAIALILLKLRGKLSEAIGQVQYRNLMSVQYPAGTMGGMSIDDHARLLAKLNKSVIRNDEVPANLNTPTDVGVFDSSNGAFVAATVLKTELDKRGYLTNFILVVDHDNAPYGQYTGDNEHQVSPDGNKEPVLYRLVSNGLNTVEAKGAALAIMACNTACTVPEAQKTVRIPVVDLIQVTAKAMAQHGGTNPVMISTPVTALSDVYPEAVLKASNGAINLKKTSAPGSGPNGETGYVHMLGAPRWAPAINNLEHLDPQKAAEMVEEIVVKVPEDASSVWLTCTHYPALQDEIQRALTKRGLDIPVINPMSYQAQAAAAALQELEKKNDPKLGKNLFENKDKVITSGKESQTATISESVNQLYRETPVETANFGQTRVQTLAAIDQQQRRRDAPPERRPSVVRELFSTFTGAAPWTTAFNAS